MDGERRSSEEGENLLPEMKKQRLEEFLAQFSGDSSRWGDSSQEEEKNKQKLITSSSDSSEGVEDIKRNIGDSSPEEEREFKLKSEYGDSDPSSQDEEEDSHSSQDEEEDSDSSAVNSEGTASPIMTREEIINIMFDPALYNNPEERERYILLHNQRMREADEENMKNKKKFELPKEELKMYGWYGKVMAADSDEYTDAKERAEDMLKYHQQVKKSGGFEVDHFPKARVCGLITPVPVGGSGSLQDEPLLGKLSCLAIAKFNRDHGREYRFNRVIKAMGRICAGIVYYITFEAKEADSAAIFEASVYLMIGDEVEIMKIDPKVNF